MIRLLHLIPIIVIIASVTATLRASEPRAFKREFAKASLSLAGGFTGLGLIVLILSLLL